MPCENLAKQRFVFVSFHDHQDFFLGGTTNGKDRGDVIVS